MVEYKITIPIIGKIFGYIYDFFTFKKKFNVMLSFSPVEKGKRDKEYYFTLYMKNFTSYYVNIGSIMPKKGDLFFPSYTKDDKGKLITKLDKQYKKKEFNFGWLRLLPSNYNKLDIYYNQEESIDLRYIGEKADIIVEFEFVDAPKSLFISNRKRVRRIIPLSFLAAR